MNAPPELYKVWRRYHREWKNGSITTLTMAEFAPIQKIIGPRFHGYMITAQGLFNAQNKQRFFMTFVARYHGLSQLGSDLLSSLGWLVPSTTYDRCMTTMLEEVKAISRSDTQQDPSSLGTPLLLCLIFDVPLLFDLFFVVLFLMHAYIGKQRLTQDINKK
jgi:hypothetical protein